jgi:hypothetical protein
MAKLKLEKNQFFWDVVLCLCTLRSRPFGRILITLFSRSSGSVIGTVIYIFCRSYGRKVESTVLESVTRNSIINDIFNLKTEDSAFQHQTVTLCSNKQTASQACRRPDQYPPLQNQGALYRRLRVVYLQYVVQKGPGSIMVSHSRDTRLRPCV